MTWLDAAIDNPRPSNPPTENDEGQQHVRNSLEAFHKAVQASGAKL
jgi:hypothetical protein